MSTTTFFNNLPLLHVRICQPSISHCYLLNSSLSPAMLKYIMAQFMKIASLLLSHFKKYFNYVSFSMVDRGRPPKPPFSHGELLFCFFTNEFELCEFLSLR